MPWGIEHYPKEATDGASETFELVVFSSYEIRERAPYLGATRLTIGELIWKTLDQRDSRGAGRRSSVSKLRAWSRTEERLCLIVRQTAGSMLLSDSQTFVNKAQRRAGRSGK
jgi:hypothetical protein